MKKMLLALVLIVALIAGYSFMHVTPVPVADAIPDGWVRSVANAEGLTYAYPPTLGIAHVTEVEWPPLVEVVPEYACNEGEERIIGGHTYCVKVTSEGAAGSTYTTYSYMTDWGSDSIRVSFTMRLVQCMNYDEPERSVCAGEQKAFAPDALADDIMTSVIR